MGKSATFEKLLAAGRDDALLRFSLGQAYLEDGDTDAAITHLAAAIAHDKCYSAAWKLLGRAQLAGGLKEEAMRTWSEGITVANGNGDRQAAKEMTVFLRRLQKQAGSG